MKLSADSFGGMKGQTLITMLTAYNTPVARCLEQAGIPIILVGDSVGMVEMGLASTREVTMEHLEYHLAAVRRGAPGTHIVGDLPYKADRDPPTALANARRLLAAGADSVKLEGPKYEVIAELAAAGIDIIGHTGLTPQTAENFRKVGLENEDAERVRAEAAGIENAGAFMIVLEHIPASLGNSITSALGIPTIGIGAGPDCDGQVLVVNDLLGLGEHWPPFSRQYAHCSEIITTAAAAFLAQVQSREFPGASE